MCDFGKFLWRIYTTGAVATATGEKTTRPPAEIWVVFRRTRKPGGFHGSSRTRKLSGKAGFFRVEEFYLNLERHETPGSVIIHSGEGGGSPEAEIMDAFKNPREWA